jgi:signal peptidase I
MRSESLSSIQMYKVSGKSMWPFLKEDSVLIIKKVEPAALKIGDLVVFKSQVGSLLVHRLIKKTLSTNNELIFRAKGDANLNWDLPFSGRDLIGKVFFVKTQVISGEVNKFKLINFQAKHRKIINFVIAIISLNEMKVVVILKRVLKIFLQ